MKKFKLLFLSFLLVFSLSSQTVADFENLVLPSDTFWDGSDLSGGFGSGNAYFLNDYSTAFSSWSGFTYSNVTDTVTPGYLNQYAAITGSGFAGSANYAIADEYGNAKVKLTGNAAGKLVKGFYVTNTTYAYLSLKNGDQFAKKFGGLTGTDPDWFRLTALGWLNGAMKQQSVDFYLADYRSADSTQDYIVKDWTWFDLQPLGNVDSLVFQLASSDTAFGFMNTPAYFAMDNFITADASYAAPIATDDEVTTTYLNDTTINVLTNDSNLVAESITVELLGSPLIPGAKDTVIDNKIYYQPGIGIVATDTLYYRVCDGLGACDTAQVLVHVTIINSLIEATETLTVVYPNPFHQFTIVQSSVNIQSVQMYDLAGSLIRNIPIDGDTFIRISTEDIPAGVYFLKVVAGTSVSVKRIVKP
ncbi:MAG: DUF4465 domain-containing protein [Chitinophagales bacterium]